MCISIYFYIYIYIYIQVPVFPVPQYEAAVPENAPDVFVAQVRAKCKDYNDNWCKLVLTSAN